MKGARLYTKFWSKIPRRRDDLRKLNVDWSISSNNQRDAALSSRIYSSLQGYSTCFGGFLHPSSGVQLKLQMESYVQFMCRRGLNPLKDVQGRESISLCHGQIWPWYSEIDSRPWTSFNGFKPTLHRHMTCTYDCICSFNVLLMMGAESTRNM
jgi:hypothetical protein